jgi:DNA repair protein RadC
VISSTYTPSPLTTTTRPEPSNADKQVTKQIRSLADIIGIELLDHVIIGTNGNYFSFRQENLFN